MVRRDTRALGHDAEKFALQYLCDKGLQLLTQNFRCRLGEIDLVMLDGDCVVFVEVRYRSAGSFARAALTVDSVKQRRLARAADLFMSGSTAHSRRVARFDVIGIDEEADGRRTVEWLQDAFYP